MIQAHQRAVQAKLSNPSISNQDLKLFYQEKPITQVYTAEELHEKQAGEIMIFEMNRKIIPMSLSGHLGDVNSVVFSPDDKWIASGSGDSTIKIWNSQTCSLYHTLTGHLKAVNSVAFSPDGKLLISGSSDGKIKFWNPHTGGSIREYPDDTKNGKTSVSFSPDGRYIVSASRNIWDILNNRVSGRLEKNTDDIYIEKIISPEFSNDGDRILCGVMTNKHWMNRGHLDAVKDPKIWMDMVVFNSNGKFIDANRLCFISEMEKEPRLSMTFSPDGRQIVSNCHDSSKIDIWDSQTFDKIGSDLGETDDVNQGVNSVAFSPDGRRIVSTSENNVIVWDVQTGWRLIKLKGHTQKVLSAGFSHDGRRIVSGGMDNTVKIWDVSSLVDGVPKK